MNACTSQPAIDYTRPRQPLFPLGELSITPGALELLKRQSVPPITFIARHWFGDWGDIGAADLQANQEALIDGDRLFSAYNLDAEHRLWIITAADRSSTTLLLPKEY